MKQQDSSDDQNRQKEKQIIRMLSEAKPIETSFVQEVSFSALFNPTELRGLIHSHNDLFSQLLKFETQAKSYKSEIDGLKQTLDKELTKEQPNIKEITDRIVKQELDSQKKEFEVEKEQLQKDLLNRVEKVLKLEMQLDESKDAYR